VLYAVIIHNVISATVFPLNDSHLTISESPLALKGLILYGPSLRQLNDMRDLVVLV
jgi:hypothetical protein